jgi:hypothetical protein
MREMKAPKCPYCGKELLAILNTVNLRFIKWNDGGWYESQECDIKKSNEHFHCYQCGKEVDGQYLADLIRRK